MKPVPLNYCTAGSLRVTWDLILSSYPPVNLIKILSPYFIQHDLNTMNEYILLPEVKETVLGNRLGEGIPLVKSLLSSVF